MKKYNSSPKTDRRAFLGSIAASATAIGMATLVAPISLSASTKDLQQDSQPDAWFNKIKGKHKMVFDVTKPHGIYPFGWPRVFLMSNGMTGTAEKDCNAVVVLRHEAIPYAFEDRIWEKYKLGEVFKAEDPATKSPAIRNPFAQPKVNEYKVPGIGTVLIGINELQASGVMFCVCNMAITVFSTALGQAMNMDPTEIKKEWLSALLPEIQIVPSGVWAVGRAQEHGCSYIFAS